MRVRVGAALRLGEGQVRGARCGEDAVLVDLGRARVGVRVGVSVGCGLG